MFTPAIGSYAKALFSLLPSGVREVAIIGGGALRCFYDKTDLADIDVFFRTNAEYDAALSIMRNHIAYRFKETKGRTEVFERVADGTQVNLIGFMWGSPQETAARFDFRCCRMVAWLSSDGGFHFHAEHGAINDAVTQTLVVLLNNGDERTLRRIKHYVEDYGYRLDLTVEEHLEPEPETDYEPLSTVPPAPVSPIVRYLVRLPRVSNGGY